LINLGTDALLHPPVQLYLGLAPKEVTALFEKIEGDFLMKIPIENFSKTRLKLRPQVMERFLKEICDQRKDGRTKLKGLLAGSAPEILLGK
jgi:hypothetical protein